MQWLDAIIQGVLLGGMYAQYALGMALMFGVMRIVNIAHGDVMILLSLIVISLAGVLPLGNIGLIVVIVPIAGQPIGVADVANPIDAVARLMNQKKHSKQA